MFIMNMVDLAQTTMVDLAQTTIYTVFDYILLCRDLLSKIFFN